MISFKTNNACTDNVVFSYTIIQLQTAAYDKFINFYDGNYLRSHTKNDFLL